MLALGIVEPLDVVEQVRACLISGSVATPVCPLQLQRREEAFHCRIVPAITPAAHAAGDVLLGQQPLEQYFPNQYEQIAELLRSKVATRTLLSCDYNC